MEAVGSFPPDATFRWSFGDGSGASEERPGFDPDLVGVVVGIQQLQCNGASGFARIELDGTADIDFNNVVGRCPTGGQNCHFSMRRRTFRQSPPPLPGDRLR